MHNVGIVQELFELTHTIAEVVIDLPPEDVMGLKQQLVDLRYLRARSKSAIGVNEVREDLLEDGLSDCRLAERGKEDRSAWRKPCLGNVRIQTC